MLILMYHRVHDAQDDPFALAVSTEHFAQQVEHLVRLGSTVPLLDSFVTSAARRVALTFDDGYVDNATTAAPLLEEAGLPATWFLTSSAIGGHHFWWDALSEALLHGSTEPSVDVRVAGRDLWLDLGTPADRRRALALVRKRLKPLDHADLVSHVAEIARACGAGAPPTDSGTMSHTQVRELAARRDMEVGAHTRTHVQLGGRSVERQREEVLGSVQEVQAMTGRPVRSFAYPFGDVEAIGGQASDLVAEAGCLVGCTTTPGLVRRSDDPYRLGRLAVGNWGQAEFAARVSAAFGGA